MKGLGRNLKYWLGNQEKQGLLILGYMLAIAAFVALLGEDSFAEEFKRSAANYIGMLLIIFPFTNAINGMYVYFTMTAAFGSKRKTSFAAMQIAYHVVMVELMAVYLVSLFVQEPQEMQELAGIAVMTGLAAVWILQGIASLLGAVSFRFGRNIGVAVYVILVVLCVGIFGLFIVLRETEVFTVTISFLDILHGPWLFLAGAALDAAMIGLFYSTIRQRDLRFS